MSHDQSGLAFDKTVLPDSHAEDLSYLCLSEILMKKLCVHVSLAVTFVVTGVLAQQNEKNNPKEQVKKSSAMRANTNYDEAKVPPYQLPDLLTLSGGRKVTSADEWTSQRRPELLELFKREMFGKSPPAVPIFTEILAEDPAFIPGRAKSRLVRIAFNKEMTGPSIDLLLVLPSTTTKPTPVFLGLNFSGNHSTTLNPKIPLSTKWMGNDRQRTIIKQRATERNRGVQASRWPYELIVDAGFGVATAYYGDIEPDYPEGWRDGVRGFIPPPSSSSVPKLANEFRSDDWGAIAAWAWGLSRCMDYLEHDSSVDAKHVAVVGHSRLGKTALWAGAQDERFFLTISNNSGAGGAALSKRNFGETVANLNTNFPHWFNGNFKKYSEQEAKMPFDQHELIALMAPRAVYVASAQEDQWADPTGEFLGALHAEPAYQLFKKKGLGATDRPSLNQSIGDTIGYHIRTGAHDITDFDWKQFLLFAKKNM